MKSLPLIFGLALTAILGCSSCHTSAKPDNTVDVISQDSLPYEYISIDTVDTNCKLQKSDCPSIVTGYPVFITQDSALNSYLNKLCLDKLLAIDDTTSYSSVQDFINSFFDECSQQAKEMEAFPGSARGWYKEHTVTVYGKIGKFLTLEESDGIYMGGAHPNSNTEYQIIDLITHRTVKASELLNLNDSSLLRLGEKYFRSNNEVADSSTLADAGYFIFGEGDDFEDSPEYGKFRFNENLALTKEGAEFLYNSYEIGPYAMGIPSLVIPYKDIQPYLRLKIW